MIPAILTSAGLFLTIFGPRFDVEAEGERGFGDRPHPLPTIPRRIAAPLLSLCGLNPRRPTPLALDLNSV